MGTPKKSKTKLQVHALRVEGELTIYRAAELKDSLLAAVAAHASVEVDLSGVTEFDTAGVQVLILAKRAAKAREGQLHLVGHSPVVLDVMDLLDMADCFGDVLVMPSAA
jgi:anti-anti-sigma factor